MNSSLEQRLKKFFKNVKKSLKIKKKSTVGIAEDDDKAIGDIYPNRDVNISHETNESERGVLRKSKKTKRKTLKKKIDPHLEKDSGTDLFDPFKQKKRISKFLQKVDSKESNSKESNNSMGSNDSNKSENIFVPKVPKNKTYIMRQPTHDEFLDDPESYIRYNMQESKIPFMEPVEKTKYYTKKYKVKKNSPRIKNKTRRIRK